MNYLAHSFLSFSYGDILLGNFIADALRGKEVERYNVAVNKGILLHRLIDTFTDHHDIVRQSKERLKPKYGKYDAVIMDILYDYFLAINWNLYASISLPKHAEKVYQTLLQNQAILPSKIQQSLPYMMRQNWLVNYGTIDGITQSLQGIARRASFVSHMEEAVEDLQLNHQNLNADFKIFFPELMAVCQAFLMGEET